MGLTEGNESRWWPVVAEYLATLEGARRYSVLTVRNYRQALAHFFGHLEREDGWMGDFAAVRLQDARSYLIEAQREGTGRRTLHLRVSALRGFFLYLRERGALERSPLVGLVVPQFRKPLPKYLTEAEMGRFLGGPERLLAAGAVSEFEHWRDRVIFELLYGGGLRISELVGLCWGMLDAGRGVFRVRGKGDKERMVPVGAEAVACLRGYRTCGEVDCGLEAAVVQNGRGGRLTAAWVQRRMKYYLAEAGLPLDLTPHKIRHSYATHLLNAGADLRLVQELMGHARLATTQVYTHVGLQRLKDVHARLHPRG